MKNRYQFLIQAFLWLLTINPILTVFPSLQFARLDPSATYQKTSQIQVQPIFHTAQIPHHQQELYQKMILALTQHQTYINTKAQEPRLALNFKDKKQQTALAQVWHQELVTAKQAAGTEQATRLTRRIQALALSTSGNTNDLNSELESCLLYEFKENYTTAKQLEQQFPELSQLNMVAPLVYDCAEIACKESDIEKAFAYSDLVHNVITICTKATTFIGKVGTAVSKGIVKGAVQSAHNLYQLTKPEHWIALAQSFKQIATLAAQECVKAEELSELIFPTTDKNYDQKFKNCMALHRAESATLHAKLKTTWNKLKETPWEQLTEDGVALGASLLLDYVTLNALGAATSAATNKVIEEIATIFKQGEIVQETYLVEVAGIGKLAIQEETFLTTVKELEKHPEKFTGKEVTITTALKEKIAKTHEKLLREKAVLFQDGPIIKIYEVKGSYNDTLNDFYKLNPSNIKSLPENKGMIGLLADGRTIAARTTSKFDTRPTLDIHTRIVDKTIKEKFRYGDLLCKKNG